MPPSPRPALILGARSDIARALARGLAAEGMPLILAGRDAAALARDAADLSLRFGVAAEARAWDARDIGGAGAFLDALPVLPGLVVCAVGRMEARGAAGAEAGPPPVDPSPIDPAPIDPEEARALVEVNFLGPALMLEAAAARMARLAEPTAAVGIGSVAGDRGRASSGWYGAAKAGFAAMLSALRQRHARSNCLVITVRPGFVATRMTEGLDLPAALTLSAEAEAALILRAIRRRRPVAIHWRWRAVMAAVRAIPERAFMRMRF